MDLDLKTMEAFVESKRSGDELHLQLIYWCSVISNAHIFLETLII